MLQGLMQDEPLSISSLIDHAQRHHGDAEIVSRRVEGDTHRTNWGALAVRARQVAVALDAATVGKSERVGTLAWNGYRHLELYYGVSGSGRVLHPVNPRLHQDQVAWIINHAADQVLCFDLTFLSLVQAIWSGCPTVRKWVALCDADQLPSDSGIPDLVSYESWIAVEAGGYDWPRFDEKAASSMCYTSGTTGHPKAALYSHRSTLLHAWAVSLPDVLGLSSRESVLPIVPMFHVNAWGIPYAAALTGCKLVLPGPALDGRSVHRLIEAEQVTLAVGVPTVWQMLLGFMQESDLSFSSLRRTVIGGAACPEALIRTFREKYGVEVSHAWGMTEMSPFGTLNSSKRKHLDRPELDMAALRRKQGRAMFGVDMKIADGEGGELPWDGKATGDLMVRGPWVSKAYFGSDEDSPLVIDKKGREWFPTGDVATIDADGFLHITDRSKDVIKSGGEWISSIEIENIAVSHPAVAMAACIAIAHPKWDERPLLVVVSKSNASVSREELLEFFTGKIAKWQIPDDVVFVSSIPVGGTGKMLKNKLREQLKAHVLPGEH